MLHGTLANQEKKLYVHFGFSTYEQKLFLNDFRAEIFRLGKIAKYAADKTSGLGARVLCDVFRFFNCFFFILKPYNVFHLLQIR